MKSIRFFLTDKCNANCTNCINRNIRKESKFIDVNKFELLCGYFKNNGVNRIRIMGGEPTLHPSFSQILNIAQQYFDRVTLFTNGIMPNVMAFRLREKDAVNFNFNFSRFITEKKVRINGIGKRVFSIVLSTTTDVELIKHEISRIAQYYSNISVSLTFDCKLNIFSHRKQLLKIFDDIFSYCSLHNLETTIDHSLPLCFLYGSNVPTHKNFSLCSISCHGLVDADFNLYCCNQDSSNKLPLFDDNRIVPFSIIENFFRLQHYKKQVKILEKICKDCPFYSKYCNGGCYIQNDEITADDIINNTEFPVIPL